MLLPAKKLFDPRGDFKTAVGTLLEKVGVEPQFVQYGITKLFLKTGILAKLEVSIKSVYDHV